MININVQLDHADRHLDQYLNADFPGLLDSLGETGVGQLQARIVDDKSSPDGEPWEDWSEAYARTRTSEHSLLQDAGPLVDTMQFVRSGLFVEIGSDLEYAPQQHAQRPFVGFSAGNVDELDGVLLDWARRI